MKLFTTTVLLVILVLSLFPLSIVAHEQEVGVETIAEYEITDDKIIFDLQLINHSAHGKGLEFSSGQQFELIITNENSEEIYRYSEGKAFTMALVYKTLGPGEVLTWQDEWDMTDKQGNKLISGTYQAEMSVVARPLGNDQLTAIIDFNLAADPKKQAKDFLPEDTCFAMGDINAEGIIESHAAKKIIKATAEEVISALSTKDNEKLVEYIHPEKGVRFTPYTHVSLERDLVFSLEQMENFFTDENSYLWGYYDGKGNEIRLTPQEYYHEFIYSVDFMHAEQIGYNEVLSTGNMLENQFEIYELPIVVEYYFSGFDPDFVGMDWRGLRLVFEEHKNEWKLVGLIHNQWTI